MGRNTLGENLYGLQRNLVEAALKSRPRGDAVRATDAWLAARSRGYESLKRTLVEMQSSQVTDFATLSVALQSVRRLLEG